MENYLLKVVDEEDKQHIVFKIAYYFLHQKVMNEWKDIMIYDHNVNNIKKIDEWFPSKILNSFSLEDNLWKTLNQILYTYYHFSMIKENCMRFYPSISLEIFNEWLKILISISSFQELNKKSIEKMSEIYFQVHLDIKCLLPIKLNFTLFQEFLLDHSFMNLFFQRLDIIRPRNLSIDMEMEADMDDLYDRSISPSLGKSFHNFELYSKLYLTGHTPYHFWISQSPTPFSIHYCLSPTSFAN